MSEQDYEQLTLFPADFLASRSALPGNAEAVKMTVTSGRRCSELLRNCGPIGLLVKTLLESSTWHSTRCFLTWKYKATKQGRLYFRLVPLTPRTDATEYASWAGAEDRAVYFVPTPRAHNIPTSEKAKRQHKSSPSLTDYVRIWPTPTARDCKGANSMKHLMQGNHTAQLANAVKLYSTPSTGAGLCGGTGNYQQLKALEESGEITPEERRSMAAGNEGQLNPEWVEALMGFPPGWTELEPDGQTEPGRQESPE